jgi:internalin A
MKKIILLSTVFFAGLFFTTDCFSQTNRDWWNSLTPGWKKVIQKQQFKGKDVTPTNEQLDEIVKMTFLELTDVKDVTSLKPAANLSMLEVIRCNRSSVESLEGIESLFNLKEIDCSDNDQINSLQPVAGLYNLEKLNCGNTMVKNLRPLKDLKKLRVLDAHYATVVDLRVLKGLDNLEILNVSENVSLFALDGIEFLPSLIELNCSKTRIDDLTPLSKLQHIQRLDISETPVKSLRPIQLNRTITDIDCSDTEITGKNLDYLYGLTGIAMLRCKDIDITTKEITDYTSSFQKRNPSATILITSKK